jgi:hypothetical protein
MERRWIGTAARSGSARPASRGGPDGCDGADDFDELEEFDGGGVLDTARPWQIPATNAPFWCCGNLARPGRWGGLGRLGGRARGSVYMLASGVPSNHIRSVTLRPVSAEAAGEGATGHALFIALDVAEPAGLLGFLEDVITRFKMERMAAPADTRFMLITLVGDVPAAEFAGAWQASIASDAPARVLLGMMEQADVMQGDTQGRMISGASLLMPRTEQPS